MRTVILSSKELNEGNLISTYKKEIEEFLANIFYSERKTSINEVFIEEYSTQTPLIKTKISMGKIFNINTIKFLIGLGYDVDIINQHRRAIEKSNNQLILESDIIIFFHYTPHSPVMPNFIEYAKSLNKTYYVLQLA